MLHLKSTTALAGLLVWAALPAAAQDQALIDAAKAEGMLTTIALPHDWCNYGGVIEGFKAKYGLQVNELNPDAGSADELEAVMSRLDECGRRVLELRLQGEPLDVIAQDTGRSERTVRRLLADIRGLLARRLGSQPDD